MVPNWPIGLLIQKIAPLFRDGPGYGVGPAGNDTHVTPTMAITPLEAEGMPVGNGRTSERKKKRKSRAKYEERPVGYDAGGNGSVQRSKVIPATVTTDTAGAERRHTGKESAVAGRSPSKLQIGTKDNVDRSLNGKVTSVTAGGGHDACHDACPERGVEIEAVAAASSTPAMRGHVRAAREASRDRVRKRKKLPAPAPKSPEDSKVGKCPKVADAVKGNMAPASNGDTSPLCPGVIDGNHRPDRGAVADGHEESDSDVQVIYVSDGRERIIEISSDSEDWDI